MTSDSTTSTTSAATFPTNLKGVFAKFPKLDIPSDEELMKLSTLDEKLKLIWCDDCFDRPKTASFLSDILKNVDTPFIFALNASYGTGKSFFVERWAKQLEIKEKAVVATFNAWEGELSPLPLKSFVDSILAAIEECPDLLTGLPKWQEWKPAFLSLAARILRYFPTVAQGISFTSVFSLLAAMGAPEELAAGIAAPISENAKDIEEKSFKEQFDRKETISDLREELKEKVREVLNIIGHQRIFVFVDELDRCRPDFSIRFLEEVKHLFAVPGLVFVLSLDLEQLQESVKHVYGYGFNSDVYLRRFFDQSSHFRKPKDKEYADVLFKRLEGSNVRTKLNFAPSEFPIPSELFAILANYFKASLRDQEQIFSRLFAILHSSKIRVVYPLPTMFMLFMQVFGAKEWKENYYTRFKNFSINARYPDIFKGHNRADDLQDMVDLSFQYLHDAGLLNIRFNGSMMASRSNERIEHFFTHCLTLKIGGDQDSRKAFDDQLDYVEMVADVF